MQVEGQDMNKVGLDSLPCPSFSYYFTDQLAGIADQVSRDHYGTENDHAFTPRQNDNTDFEFLAFPEAGDYGVYFNDTVFPLFNRDLLSEQRSGGSGRDSTEAEDAAALRFSMASLLIGVGEDSQSERDPPPSPSPSSEADDLEGVPPGSYCVWTPNSPQASPNRCKKSNSTGSLSSKPWKLLDLLWRTNSVGKGLFVFVTPSPAKKKRKEQWSSGSIEVAGKPRAKGFSGREKKASVSAHEALYVRNRELRSVEKRRSFLPYRQDLVGFCARRLGKAFTSF